VARRGTVGSPGRLGIWLRRRGTMTARWACLGIGRSEWAVVRRRDCWRRRAAGGATTGFRNFAECQKHSAKLILHLVKILPSTALGKVYKVKIVTTKKSLPSAFSQTISKILTVCKKITWQNKT